MNKQKKSESSRGIEVWRDIPEYPHYQASSNGDVRSLPHATTKGRVLKQALNNSGYLRVAIGRNGYQFVHRLVALAFVGKRPQGMDINHINGDKTDNSAKNLEYVSRRENMAHARHIGLHDNRGEKHYGSKLTESQVIDIRRAFELAGVDETEIAPSLGVSTRTIRDILENKTWRHVK